MTVLVSFVNNSNMLRPCVTCAVTCKFHKLHMFLFASFYSVQEPTKCQQIIFASLFCTNPYAVLKAFCKNQRYQLFESMAFNACFILQQAVLASNCPRKVRPSSYAKIFAIYLWTSVKLMWNASPKYVSFVTKTGQGSCAGWNTATVYLTSLLTQNSSHIHLISTGKYHACLS